MLTIPTHIVAGQMAEKLEAIAAAGFEAIDLSISDVAQFDGPLDALATLIDKAGLKIVSLGAVPSGASAVATKAKIDLAKALGGNVLIVDVAGQVPEDLPKSGDVRLALRPTRAAEAGVVKYITKQNDPNIGLALNAFELLGDGSRPARLRDLDGATIFHVALWDGPNTPMLPGQGTLNLGGLARVLARAGYNGPWSVGAAPEGRDTLRNAYRSLVTALSDAAQTEPLLQGTTPDLPAKVPANGF
ncbi:sugar phosphate isomerase/epimerase family protein, partial [Pseudooctadecabacter sp.]|uniref:sugar phosphate isomerase/epimerase family protein n=1 Tax=Pseudooctadecabacter sp. TaxID=1966338 RepID=UPI0035C7AB20